MEPLDLYREFARRFGRDAFLQRYPGFFLVKRPTAAGTMADAGEASPLSYRTSEVRSAAATPFNEDTFHAEWRAARLEKRPGNPFPDRVSIGRAPNCDVVARLPFLSKLHAHFVLATAANTGATSVSLVDLKSANGSFVNGERLVPNVPHPLNVDDSLRFGALEVTLTEVSTFYQLLQQEARTG